jgi:hypothetical protein
VTITENPHLRQEEIADVFPLKFPCIRTIPEVKIMIPSFKAKIS